MGEGKVVEEGAEDRELCAEGGGGLGAEGGTVGGVGGGEGGSGCEGGEAGCASGRHDSEYSCRSLEIGLGEARAALLEDVQVE